MGLEERRRREKENRKQAILKAARKLFLEKGFKAVTVDHIAQKAELSKGSVYLYFKSKEEIYTYILLNDIEKFHRKINDSLRYEDLASDTLKRLARIYVDFFLKEKELFRIFMAFMLNTDQMNLPESQHSRAINMTNKTIMVFEKALQDGIDKGEFPSSISLRQSRNILWGLLNGVISLYLFTGPVTLREDRIRTTMEAGLNTFIQGLKYKEYDRLV